MMKTNEGRDSITVQNILMAWHGIMATIVIIFHHDYFSASPHSDHCQEIIGVPPTGWVASWQRVHTKQISPGTQVFRRVCHENHLENVEYFFPQINAIWHRNKKGDNGNGLMCIFNLCRSHRKCFRSILTVHNETGNIWWEKDIVDMNKLIKQKLSSSFTWSLYHTTGFRTILTPDQSLGATCWDASFSSDLLLSSFSITPRRQGSTSQNQLFGIRL